MKFIGEIKLLLFRDESDDCWWNDVRRYKDGKWERRMGESWESDSNDALEFEYKRMVSAGECPDQTNDAKRNEDTFEPLAYKCEGGQGCAKPGCQLVAKGSPESKTEKVYMCPYNHWRGCKWVEIKKRKRL